LQPSWDVTVCAIVTWRCWERERAAEIPISELARRRWSTKSAILRKFERIEHDDIDFRSCEIVAPEAFAFPPSKGVWKSEDEEARAKALCVQLGGRIYKANPLGYGKMGLLIVFPTTVPNNSLPILHSYSLIGSTSLGFHCFQGW
jgi:hypothetical protein